MITKRSIPYLTSYVVLLLTISCNSKIATTNIDRLEQVQKIVNAYDSIFGFSGAVLIGQGDSIFYQRAQGFANIEKKIPNTLDTKFRLASLSKQFTAAALLILEQNGKVDFDRPISNYIDGLKPEIAERINIHQLLSHSSGLGRDIESLTEEELGKSYIPIDDIIQLINSSELLFEPGEKWSYSNLGYAIAAKIIETETGLSYGDALENLIFKPLNMQRTAHEASGSSVMDLANGYVGLPDSIVSAAYEDKSYVIGAGSIYSTVNDLFIWSRTLLKGDLISKENRDKLFTKQAGRYSYGWFIDTYVWPPVNDDTQAVNPHHEGGSPGFESKMSILTQHDAVVIILCNKLPSHLSGITNRITNSFLGFEESAPKPDGSQEFFETLFGQGIDPTISLIEKWENAGSKHLIPAIDDIYLIGRGYMDNNEYEKAILIMDFLTEVKPKWSYPYLFKAIMLENQSKDQEAIELYEKILEIEPGQSNALMRLKKLKKSN